MYISSTIGNTPMIKINYKYKGAYKKIYAKLEYYNVTGSIKGYGTAAQNQLAGYTGTVDTSKLKDGKHEIIVKVIDSNTKEVLRTRKKNILCRKI